MSIMRRKDISELEKTAQLLRRLIRIMISQELGERPKQAKGKPDRYIVTPKTPADLAAKKGKLEKALFG